MSDAETTNGASERAPDRSADAPAEGSGGPPAEVPGVDAGDGTDSSAGELPPTLIQPGQDSEALDEEKPSATAEISIDSVPVVNLAMQHNDVRVVHRVGIMLQSESPLADVELRLEIGDELGEPVTRRLSSLTPGQQLLVEDLDLSLHAAALARVTEGLKTTVRATLLHQGLTIGTHAVTVRVLPSDHWPGSSRLPEVLAAFVTPNHPALAPIIKRTSELLGEATGDAALGAYMSSSVPRIRATVQALYRALVELDIGYITPPPGFADSGQRVRLPDQVVATRMGTCIDLAVLVASAVEAVGLHPLIVVIDGHAFPAIWTGEQTFAEGVITDAARLRKRIDLGEIVAFESTVITHRPSPDFLTACHATARHLGDSTFRYALDLIAARRAGIRPLPLRADGQVEVEAGSTAAPGAVDFEHPATLIAPAREREPLSPGEQRLIRWKRKLLDLSLRNRLINLRPTKQTISLECPDIAAFEDALSDGAVFTVLPRAKVMEGDDPRDAAAHERRTGGDARREYLLSQLAEKRVHADLGEQEISRRLVDLYRAARASVSETGANTLYLALGSLLWYESPQATQPRRAPLVLLPMQLERASVREGFHLSRTDDEPRVNVTLLEKLRSEFGIDTRPLEELPEDASGLHIIEMLRRFREVIKDIDRWDIAPTADLGLFSFSKFLLWLDIHQRTDELLQSPVVQLLVDREHAPPPGGTLPDASRLDEDLAPADTFCPLDADSSQLAAVVAAAGGRSFVLEGPPGTGKSQTITNLIGQALGQGQRVLFVAEKQAALNVVHQRLTKVGLGEFCLELHSNKAGKKGVVEQIVRGLQAHNAQPPGGWETSTAALLRVREELNAQARALHVQRPLGISVYDAFCRLARLESAPRVPLEIADAQSLPRETLDHWRETVRSAGVTAHAVAPVGSHPLRGVGLRSYSSSLPDACRKHIAETQQASEVFEKSLDGLLQSLSISRDAMNVRSLPAKERDAILDIARLLQSAPGATEAILSEGGWSELKASLEAWIDRAAKADALRARLLEKYRPELLTLELPSLLTQLRSADAANFMLFRWWKARTPRKILAGVAVKPLPKDVPALIADLTDAQHLNAETAALAEPGNDAARLFGRAWNGGKDIDAARLHAILTWVDAARPAIRRLELSQAIQPLAAPARRLATSGIDDLAAGSPIRNAIDSALASHDLWRSALTSIQQALAASPDALLDPAEGGTLAGLCGVLARWKSALDELPEWCAWQRQRAEIPDALAPLLTAYEAGSIPTSRLPDAAERSVLERWLASTIDAEPVLRDFSPELCRDALARFRELDRTCIELAARLLRARLAERLPAPGGSEVDGSEMGLLLRESRKQRRHLPVRRLVEKLPNLLPRLKPCLLMSPLSVAQYLDPAFPPFDLVVFDEASQIPVWDAIGAIARARHAVIVGDSKQLPPTNFFQHLEGGDDASEEDFDELESVLDEANAGGLPAMRLRWHYRSRHESLIAFSNHRYYDDQLFTFPSPVRRDDHLGVSLRLIEGKYDRSRTRTNLIEGQALVDEMVRRLKLAAAGQGTSSIGVVTFSQAQQVLIEDLLDEQRRQHPEIEPFFTEDDGVFVKNLESVQGDERDVILFSVGYGPDADGRLLMSFGPLNRLGGERRLNVAVTRAREQVIVFSSIHPDQIDLSRTSSRGAAHLRAFLEYAHRQTLEDPTVVATEAETYPAPQLAAALARALTDRGWVCDLAVGCSGYRLDLAVRHPSRPGRHLLGIEFDGAFYAAADTARDRDRLRQQVLTMLGWRLMRLWSQEWRRSPTKVVQRVEQELERALRESPTDAQAAPQPTDPLLKQNAPASGSLFAAPGDTPTQTRPPTVTAVTPQADSEPATPYTAFDTSVPKGEPEAFYDGRSNRSLAASLRKIVQQEGPIVPGLAARRLAALWGITRVTSRVESRLAEILAWDSDDRKPVLIEAVLWPADLPPEAFDGFRTAGEADADRRDIDDIPLVEVTNAAHLVLRQHIAIPRAELARQAGSLLGFGRCTLRIEERVSEAVEALRRRGLCELRDDMVQLT